MTDPVSLGWALTLGFLALIVYIVRTVPQDAAAKIIGASATLMACIPTILFVLGAGQ